MLFALYYINECQQNTISIVKFIDCVTVQTLKHQ
jgi:hypothetical protein